jgi:hypothetical protein
MRSFHDKSAEPSVFASYGYAQEVYGNMLIVRNTTNGIQAAIKATPRARYMFTVLSTAGRELIRTNSPTVAEQEVLSYLERTK